MKTGYFDAKEFASKDGKPSPYIMNVQDSLVHLLNKIRGEFGMPIIVNSGYRSPEHNEVVGGVANSYHVQGLAADIRPKYIEDLPELQALCDKMNPHGGVGFYDTFCHVDTRGSRARWDNRTK